MYPEGMILQGVSRAEAEDADSHGITGMQCHFANLIARVA